MKFITFLDPGHGGIVNGQYVTPGKRSPKFPDGKQLFEGVQNRLIVKLIHDKLLAAALPEHEIYNVSPGDLDTPLENRTKFANDLWVSKGKPKAILISVHADAGAWSYVDKACTIKYDAKVHIPKPAKFYYKEEWHPGSGLSVYTSIGQNDSDIFASMLIAKLEVMVPGVKWRTDGADGDKDKEENFWMTRKTLMPSVLSENGFMTNEIECKRMLTPEWREQVAEAHFQAILEFRKKQLGL